MEKTEEKMLAAATKLDKASTACDDSERAKKVFQSKAEEDEKRIAGLEKDLKDARDKAETADITYEVVGQNFHREGCTFYLIYSNMICQTLICTQIHIIQTIILCKGHCQEVGPVRVRPREGRGTSRCG